MRHALLLFVIAVACDKGKVEPTKGSAAPAPVPLPSPDPAPAPDAMTSEEIDEQLLQGSDAPWVEVRACNDSGKDFKTLVYHDNFDEGALGSGQCTNYRKTKRAYSYTYAKFTIGTDAYVIQPIDYIGETPLEPGQWSFHISKLDAANHTADIRAKSDFRDKSIPIRVRVCNDTKYDIKILSSPVSATSLAKHVCSDYEVKDHAFTAASIIFDIGKDRFNVTPADMVGATPLDRARWTYHLTIVDYANKAVRFDAKRD